MIISPAVRAGLSAIITVGLLVGFAQAEIPDTFTNLEVFPKDIGKRQLMGAMRDFSTSLGVRCNFCHIQKTPGDFDSIDWVSDELEHKQAARGMMTMVQKINSEMLPAATGKNDARITCITCHRGLTDPRTLQEVLLDTVEKDGAEVGISRYRELRDKYYGSGSYDFGPATLTTVAETLAQSRGDMEGAVKVLELGAEMNPDDVSTHLMRFQVLVFYGDKEGAVASARRVLELEPDNETARKFLDQMED